MILFILLKIFLATDRECPVGFQITPKNSGTIQVCLKKYETPETRVTARFTCHQEQFKESIADLVIIETLDKENVVRPYAYTNSPIWIGLKRSSNNAFLWVNGDELGI